MNLRTSGFYYVIGAKVQLLSVETCLKPFGEHDRPLRAMFPLLQAFQPSKF